MMAIKLVSHSSLAEARSTDARLARLALVRDALDTSPVLQSIYIGYADGSFFYVRSLRDDADRALFDAPRQAAYAVRSVELAARLRQGHHARIHHRQGHQAGSALRPHPRDPHALRGPQARRRDRVPARAPAARMPTLRGNVAMPSSGRWTTTSGSWPPATRAPSSWTPRRRNTCFASLPAPGSGRWTTASVSRRKNWSARPIVRRRRCPRWNRCSPTSPNT